MLLAALASVSVAVVYSLTKRTLDETGGGGRNFQIFVAAIAALGGLFSPIFLSEVGTTYNDYYGSILILLALWLFIRKADGMRTYLVIGALLGVAVGVKLTNAIFILGWVAAIVAIDATSAWRPLLLSGIGAFAAYIPVGGIWNAYVYGLFNNPVFPLYNNIFKSDAYGHVSMLDTRFKPHSVAEALTYFPRWALGDPTTTELVFRDTRFMFSAFFFCLALPRMLAVVMPRRKGDAPPIFDPERSRFILVFSIVSFVIWLAAFGIERYALVLEQVAPLIFLILLSHLCGGRRVFAQAAVMGMGLIIATSKAPDWGRAPFSDDWYKISAPAAIWEDGTMFVMLSGEPTAYIIPYLPQSDSFIRIEGNMPLDPGVGIGVVAKARIGAHEGQIRTLAPADIRWINLSDDWKPLALL